MRGSIVICDVTKKIVLKSELVEITIDDEEEGEIVMQSSLTRHEAARWLRNNRRADRRRGKRYRYRVW